MNRSENPVRTVRSLDKITPSDAFNSVKPTIIDSGVLSKNVVNSGVLVVYASIFQEGADLVGISEQDPRTALEAKRSGGLYDYRPGKISDQATIDSFNENDTENDMLSNPNVVINYCIWRSEEDAKRARVLPEHQKAEQMGRDNHQEYNVFKYKIARVGDALIFVPIGNHYYNADDHPKENDSANA